MSPSDRVAARADQIRAMPVRHSASERSRSAGHKLYLSAGAIDPKDDGFDVIVLFSFFQRFFDLIDQAWLDLGVDEAGARLLIGDHAADIEQQNFVSPLTLNRFLFQP